MSSMQATVLNLKKWLMVRTIPAKALEESHAKAPATQAFKKLAQNISSTLTIGMSENVGLEVKKDLREEHSRFNSKYSCTTAVFNLK